jgi:hypothetical protein
MYTLFLENSRLEIGNWKFVDCHPSRDLQRGRDPGTIAEK